MWLFREDAIFPYIYAVYELTTLVIAKEQSDCGNLLQYTITVILSEATLLRSRTYLFFLLGSLHALSLGRDDRGLVIRAFHESPLHKNELFLIVVITQSTHIGCNVTLLRATFILNNIIIMLAIIKKNMYNYKVNN